MNGDERLRRYQEAGAEFVETARARAEEFLRLLSNLGDSSQDKAEETIDDLVETGRRNTGLLFEIVRREIASQLSLLGLATKEDLANLEAKLTAAPAKKTATKALAPAKKAAAAKAPTAKKTVAKKATVKKSAAAKKAPAKKAPAKKTGRTGAS